MYNQNFNEYEQNFGKMPHHYHDIKPLEYSNRGCEYLPIAIAYVPFQTWGETFRPDVALSKGTIFKELDLPFLGRR